MKETEKVIQELRELIQTQGYFYALCMMLLEDFLVDPEKLHELNHSARLSINEAGLLLGFLIQNEIDFTTPDTPNDLALMKEKTYTLLQELHQSFMNGFIEKLKDEIGKEHVYENHRNDQKSFFGSGDMFIEPIFYASSGAYDFQYMDFLERKYKYDQDWLLNNKHFKIFDVKKIVPQIKTILQNKSKKVNVVHLKERLPEFIEEMKVKNPSKDWDKQVKDNIFGFEMYQYVKLFFDDESPKSGEEWTQEDGWNAFYNNLIDLFVIKKTDFDKKSNIETFLNNFSIIPKTSFNAQFQNIGNYNIIRSHPIIQLDDERFFVPVTFMLFQAVYESPFYWMLQDKKYIDNLGINRGKVGEEITYDYLSEIFGTDNIFQSIKIQTKKGHDDTDIDVLGVLGSKALCIQVKSKPLTLLSRQGDDKQLKKDFQGAVQDAYNQGIICRKKILDKQSVFIDKDGTTITLSEEIDEIYLMCITTENYPSLTHQAHVMLEKKDCDPYPIVLTAFDLELLVHYLADPFDFLYYIKQRVELMDYFRANEEMAFLGYHLDQKLWKIADADFCGINSDFAQLIDRNYFPIRAGIQVSDEGDDIQHRWKNKQFEQLCTELNNINESKITDILFYLFDCSGETRKNIVDNIFITKQKTLQDDKNHDFSMPPDEPKSSTPGFSYFSLRTDNIVELKNMMFLQCQLKKYKTKCNVWIGFGSLKNSKSMIDGVVIIEEDWEYDSELEENSKILQKGQKKREKLGEMKNALAEA